MIIKEDVQKAISLGFESRLGVMKEVFEKGSNGWQPTKKCLSQYFSSGERVICSVLLCFYFEVYGRPDYVEIPDKEYKNSVTDIVWPGAWYFYSSLGLLTNAKAWEAIKVFLLK